ncbi:T9SS type B sorting domain-containing protein [Flavobacterium sp. LHD-80]|uniref:T9SS type B sorting domain-containing protein n=1 Tax=Flavobacterium sp. LHD-80 TaxID=3071411 RepID=UPI0027E19BDA|nr:T9SS type B sorting domain-containing protein [Flavobacterium sp. LHD-80]MDQ6470958.1 T9SS type B sorting domain-containing protein [Flavobacterium sp. LHD-80]
MNPVKILFLLILFSFKIYAQNDCTDFITVCGNSNLSGLTAVGPGLIQDFKDISRCKVPEDSSLWLKINIVKGGTLGFTLNPESSDLGVDFDFYVFGPNVSCDNLKEPIRYTYSNPVLAKLTTNKTGMSATEIDYFEGVGVQQDCKDLGSDGNAFVKWLNVLDNESYFIVICRYSGQSKFSITWNGTAKFSEPPFFKNQEPQFALNLEKCDTDGVDDDKTIFDLTQNTNAAVDKQDNVEITYHTTANDAILGINPIVHPEAYTNTSLSENIYIRLNNTVTKCFTTAEFSINLTKHNLSFPITSVGTCDDSSDGSDTNGKAVFYLKDITETLFPNKKDLNIKYFLSQNDAVSDTNELINSFYNTISGQQSIYAKAFDAFYCAAIQKITLIVNSLPAKTNASLTQCDSSKNGNGLVHYNLDQANDELTNKDSRLTTSFFLNKDDALNNVNLLDKDFHNTSNPQTLFARITNSDTKCSSIGTLVLKTNPIIIAAHSMNPKCDDDGIEDGVHLFDLTAAGISATKTQTIKYYNNEMDALLEKNAIQNTTSYQNETPYSQDVFARIEENNSCLEIHKIKLTINKLPQIEANALANICENNRSYFANLDAGLIDINLISEFSYQWTKDGVLIPNQTSSKLNVNEIGNYEIRITNKSNCSKTRTISVSASNTATITSIDVIDLQNDDSNKITVNATGKGEYEYSLDNPNGPFQESNVFENVSSGIHEIYINDRKNCGITSKTTAVVGAPSYFTPNNDGYHDYWNIAGLNISTYKNAIIYIYDRFGKLLKQLHSSDLGWDGTFVGSALPADDYWYSLKLEDNREAKGHFSLKR